MDTIQLNLGDCITGMRSLPDGVADDCFTDPPYGIGYRPGHRKKNPLAQVVNDNLKPREFQELMDAAFTELRRVLKPDSVIHVCGGWSVLSLFVASNRSLRHTRQFGKFTLREAPAFSHCL